MATVKIEAFGRGRSTAICSSPRELPFSPTKMIPMDFSCSVCEGLLKDAILTGCCGRNLCTHCLEKWRRIENPSNESCPVCEEKSFTFMKDHKIDRQMRNEVVYCKNKKEGCTWVGSVTEVRAHLLGEYDVDPCPIQEISCPQNCGGKVKRQDLPKHLQNKCFIKWKECEFCSVTVPEVSLKQHLESACPSYPVVCPNNCNFGAKLKRSELEQHLSSCSLQNSKCPFYKVGCEVELLRKEQESHLEAWQKDHLMLAYRSLSSDMKDLKLTLKAVQEKQHVAENELDKAKFEIAEVQMQVQEQTGRTQVLASVLHQELNFLVEQPHNSVQKILSCECMRTTIGCMLDPTNGFLDPGGPPLTFRLTDYSKLKEAGKPWYSPPFFVENGYKMCISVHLNGEQEGKGTHVSVHIHMVAGEYDSNLKWPLAFNKDVCIHLMQQVGVTAKSSTAVAPSSASRNPFLKKTGGGAMTMRNRQSEPAVPLVPFNNTGIPQRQVVSDLPVTQRQRIRSVVFNLHRINRQLGTIGLPFGQIALFCSQSSINDSVLCGDSLVFQLQI